MAGNKKRIGLDQPHGDTLGKIDDVLAWLVESEQDNHIKADEFTVDMAGKKMQTAGLQVSDAALRCKLSRMAKSGQLTSRLIRLNGKMTSVYKRVTG